MANANKSKLTLVGLAVAGLLSGCGADANVAPAQTTPPGPETATRPVDTPATSPATSMGTPAAPGRQADMTAGFGALALAQSEVPGSRAIEIDLEDDGTWEVGVIVGDRKVEFDISADASRVIDRDEVAADTNDIRRLAQAQITIEEAIQTAMSAVDGQFDDAELDEKQGTIVWEIDLGDVDVDVDAITGQIVTR